MKNLKGVYRRFNHTNHKLMWDKLKTRWKFVQKHGLTEAKSLIRGFELKDYTEILNNCYACEYAQGKQTKTTTPTMCRRCPLEMDLCSSPDSPFKHVVDSIANNDEQDFKNWCDVMVNLKVKEGVICE